MMMAYAYAPGCRRAFLLDYFGDEVHRCGGDALPCDTCAARRDDAAAVRRRSPAGAQGAVVRGAAQRRVRAQAGGALPQRLGCARGRRRGAAPRLHVRGAARPAGGRGCSTCSARCEASGLIIAEGDEYPCLRITAAGREVMLDRARMQAALPPERAAAASGCAMAAAGGGGGGGSGATTGRSISRCSRACASCAPGSPRRSSCPAYCVFHDRTLAALARQRPATLDELAQVPGVGPSKLAKYGAAFLEALRAPEG